MIMSITLVGAVGWWLGTKIGLMTAFILSGIGSVAGVYLGWRINRTFG
jgi:hypothetical protein